jgi:hypothetical protein
VKLPATASLDSALAACVLAAHLLFILWVVFGALLVRFRPWLRWVHIPCLIWGVLVELLLWPCPLTLLENWLEVRAGVQPYQEGFLLHYLDATVYPNVSPALLTVAGVVVCGFNLGVYVWFFARERRQIPRGKSGNAE